MRRDVSENQNAEKVRVGVVSVYIELIGAVSVHHGCRRDLFICGFVCNSFDYSLRWCSLAFPHSTCSELDP